MSQSFYERLLEEYQLQNIGQISWAHAVNSRQKLQTAITDESIHFLEVDINAASDGSILVAHNADDASDVGLVEIVQAATGTNKGLKFDFKNQAVVNEVLPTLAQVGITNPIILNADIQSVAGAPDPAVDAERFITDCRQVVPGALLSLGWRTTGNHNEAYRMEDIIAIQHNIEHVLEVTIPVRASLLPHSWSAVKQLLDQPGKTLTIWNGGPVDTDLWSWLQEYTDPERCFYDLQLV